MKKFGIVDMGTNSIRLLLAKVVDGKIAYSEKYLEMTRLGQGVDETKMLSEISMGNSIDAILKFKEMAKGFGVEELEIIATSAVRDAKNRNEFVERVKKSSGFDIDVISGEEEAELGFVGVLAGVGSKESVLMIDIGGGSTEFVIGSEKVIELSVSENVGAVRMTGKHISTELISEKEKENLISDIDRIITNTLELINNSSYSQIVGIGGTLTTISAIKQKMLNYDSELIHNSIINKMDIDEILIKLGESTNVERKKNLGLAPKRADIIYAGVMIIERILKNIGKEKIIISDYDNLEGYIFKKHIKKC